ncbi:hypothetical protein BGX31_005549 [Mortierella sp. GBA43]|nr:hypothetical protein BGX31_005549 [Mortierella sp. GBA43]
MGSGATTAVTNQPRPKKLEKSILRGEYWTPDTLRFYGIVIQNATIPNHHPHILTPKAKAFQDEDMMVRAGIHDSGKTYYARSVRWDHKKEQNRERLVKWIWCELLDGVVNANPLSICPPRTVGHVGAMVIRPAPGKTEGFMEIPVYTTRELKGIVQQQTVPDTEASMVATAISSCLRWKWPENLPIYMFRTLNGRTTIYRALIGHDVRERVQNSRPAAANQTSTMIHRYRCKSVPEGFRLVNVEERHLLLRFLCYTGDFGASC